MPISVLRPTRRGPVAIVVAALLFLTACGADAESAITTAAPSTTTAAPATTTSAPPTTTAPPTDEDLILEAAENYWYAILAANTDPSDASHPDLLRWASGPALARTQEIIRERQANGLSGRLPEGAIFEVSAEIVSVEPGDAIVVTCLLDESVEYVVATGEVTKANPLSIAAELRVLEPAPGRWEVTASALVSQTDGTGGCES